MPSLTIASPGVQINEVDLSPLPVLPTGTNVLVAGYSPTGPAGEPIQVPDLPTFEQIYGTPNTPAERYFYQSVAPLLNTNANVYAYRLPYGPNNGFGFGSNYGALVYPCSAIDISNDGGNRQFGRFLSTLNQFTSGVMFCFGTPIHFELTQTQYNQVLQRQGFSWQNSLSSVGSIVNFEQLGTAGMIILNEGQTTIDNIFEGFYVGVIDNTNVNPALNYNNILNVLTITQSAVSTQNYLTLPSTRLNFILSGLSDNQVANTVTYGQQSGSISEVLENAATFDIGISTYDDTIIVGLFKLKQSPFSPNTIKLDYVFAEKYVGSLDYNREIPSTQGGAPNSFYIETGDEASQNLTIIVNDYISQKFGTTWLNATGNPSNKVRFTDTQWAQGVSYFQTFSASFGITSLANLQAISGTLLAAYSALGPTDNLYPLGAYGTTNPQSTDLGSVPLKLDKMFGIMENTELYDIDITIDAGLSTIFAVQQYIGSNYFTDTIYISSVAGFATTDPTQLTPDAQTFRNNWLTITQKFTDFASLKRQDHIYISDLPRHFFVQGTNFLPSQDPTQNFSLNVYSPIKNILASIDTSYATTYANWVKVFDTALDDNCWVPSSGFVAASMATTDENFQPWFAPAGFTRGVLNGAVDIALYPKQKQRDQLYKVSTNPIAFFPNEGFVIYGQKTLLKKPSAFDRINVRRLFLNLEKATRDTVKFFVFEPNTLLTRTRVVNTLKPIFENAKNTEGLYDYLIVCDERNNTPAIIDQNELIVDIYLKPVRTAEFILVNFYATRTDANFTELVG